MQKRFTCMYFDWRYIACFFFPTVFCIIYRISSNLFLFFRHDLTRMIPYDLHSVLLGPLSTLIVHLYVRPITANCHLYNIVLSYLPLSPIPWFSYFTASCIALFKCWVRSLFLSTHIEHSHLQSSCFVVNKAVLLSYVPLSIYRISTNTISVMHLGTVLPAVNWWAFHLSMCRISTVIAHYTAYSGFHVRPWRPKIWGLLDRDVWVLIQPRKMTRMI